MADTLEFADDEQKSESNVRKVGKYEIHETLGKGAYSWVKRGIDTSNNEVVALKFLNRADKLNNHQSEQVRTEIKSLTLVRHENVMRLLAYNLSAKYPTNTGGRLKTVLLVLEFCPGGELFDLLYYAKRLDETTARTYFRQTMNGLKAIHAKGIAHRDIKPQNLLLDENYCIKITDFGLSKIIESEEERLMKTTYVGTRGYQAPEMLKNLPFTIACDIFSSAVVLFILVAGYPPFEGAHKTDKWYKAIAEKDMDKFWHYHRKAQLSADVKELLAGMFCYKASKRWTLDDVFNSKWFNGPILKDSELKPNIIERIREAKRKRKKDAKRAQDKSSLRDIEYDPKYEAMPAKKFMKLSGLRMFYTRLTAYRAILYLNHVLTTSKLLSSTTYEPEKSPHSFLCVTGIDKRSFEFSVSAYKDPLDGVHTIIHFQTIRIPDSLSWARLYREVLSEISQYDIFLDDLPIVAHEKHEVEEEKTQSMNKTVVIEKPLRTKPVTEKLVRLDDGYK